MKLHAAVRRISLPIVCLLTAIVALLVIQVRPIYEPYGFGATDVEHLNVGQGELLVTLLDNRTLEGECEATAEVRGGCSKVELPKPQDKNDPEAYGIDPRDLEWLESGGGERREEIVVEGKSKRGDEREITVEVPLVTITIDDLIRAIVRLFSGR